MLTIHWTISLLKSNYFSVYLRLFDSHPTNSILNIYYSLKKSTKRFQLWFYSFYYRLHSLALLMRWDVSMIHKTPIWLPVPIHIIVFGKLLYRLHDNRMECLIFILPFGKNFFKKFQNFLSNRLHYLYFFPEVLWIQKFSLKFECHINDSWIVNDVIITDIRSLSLTCISISATIDLASLLKQFFSSVVGWNFNPLIDFS